VTEKVFPPGSPQPSTVVSKVYRATSAVEGISYLRILPATVERLDYCWVREGTPDAGQTWKQINTHALRDISSTDDRPADQRPPISLAEATRLMGERLGVDPADIGAEIEDAVNAIKRQAGPAARIRVTDLSMVEQGFSLAASDPGAYAARRSWPSEYGEGKDYEPVSAWVAHACAHVAISLLPKLIASQHRIQVEPGPVTTVDADQLDDAATMLHRDECYDGCDVHSMTAFREKALRMFGAAGVLAVGVPAAKVAEIRVSEHRKLVSIVTGVPLEKLP
jgi:hypothetical protein